MTVSSVVTPFSFVHQFKSREARDNWAEVLDRAESGAAPVVKRNQPLVLLGRDIVSSLIKSQHPVDVKVSVTDSQVSMWLDSAPIHGVGKTFEEAEGEFLDALLDYAALWFEELRYSPNHRDNQSLVILVTMFAENTDELRAVIFDD